MPKHTCPREGILIAEEECLARQKKENAAADCGECKFYHKNTPTFRLAQKLFDAEGLIGKPEYHMDGDYFVWRFHEDFFITASTVEMGLGYIEVNDGWLSLKPYAEDMYQDIVEIASGRVVLITKIGVAGRYASGIFPLEVYEAKRKKLRFGIKTRVFTAKGEIE